MIDWFDLPKLITFTAGSSSFVETTSLSLSSMIIDDWLIWSYSTHYIQNRRLFIHRNNKFKFIKYDSWIIDWFDLPKLTTFTTGYMSFSSTKVLSFSSDVIDDLLIRSYESHYILSRTSFIWKCWRYYSWKYNSSHLFIQDIPLLQNLDLNCPFRNYKTAIVERMISIHSSFLDASLFEDCYCFKYDVVCSKDDLDELSRDVEGIVIGNGCMKQEDSIDFSEFLNVSVIDVGFESLSRINKLDFTSCPIVNWLIWSS